MLDLTRLTSPIQPSGAIVLASGGATLRDCPFVGKLMLYAEAGAKAQLADVLGARLPGPGRALQTGALTILSLAPDTYLLVAVPNAQYDWIDRLQRALAGTNAALVDLSSARAMFTLRGRAATDLLWRGCGIDLEPPSFSAGSCASTKLGKIGVVIHRVDDLPSFELYVSRSLAHSLWLWLLEVAQQLTG